MLGNRLLRTMVLFLYVALFCGIPAVMEHPATWYNPPRPSSFLLPDVEHLVSLGAMLHLVHQCAFGAPWFKPTGLLSTRPDYTTPRLTLMPRQGKCTGGHEHQPLLGVNERSEFKTMQAKMYPLVLIVTSPMFFMILPGTFLLLCLPFHLLTCLRSFPLSCCNFLFPLILITFQKCRATSCCQVISARILIP